MGEKILKYAKLFDFRTNISTPCYVGDQVVLRHNYDDTTLGELGVCRDDFPATVTDIYFEAEEPFFELYNDNRGVFVKFFLGRFLAIKPIQNIQIM